MAQHPLAGLKVLDLGQEIAGPYCAKLLAALGAEVVKVEPPAGDPARRRGPFPEDLPHPERSGLFLYLNTGKRGVTLDIRTATGRDLLLRLAAWADVAVESFAPGVPASLDLGYDALRQVNPQLVLASVTPFGQSGPYRDYRATEAGLHAISGEMSVAGEPREPLKKGGEIAQYLGGLHAFLGIFAALFQREETGEGEHVDVSLAEGMTSIIGAVLREQAYLGRPPRRKQHARAWPEGIRACKDGYVLVFTRFGTDWWPDFAALLDGPPAGESVARPQSPEEEQAWDARLSAWLQAHTKQEIYHQAQQHRLSFGYVATAPDLLAAPQLAHRRFFEQVEHPQAGMLTLMGLPFLLDGERWPLGRAPLLGEHNEAVYCDMLGLSRQELVQLAQLGVI